MELELPSHLEVRDQGTSLEIVRRWSGWERIPFTLCAVAVDGFVLYWDTVMDNLGAIDTGGGKPMAVILSLLLTYIALIRWFNRTHIQIDRDKLTIQHKPLPYFGNKTVSASAITQCYAKQIVTTVGTDRGPVTYEVRERAQGGREMKLVGGLESAEQTLFIEQRRDFVRVVVIITNCAIACFQFLDRLTIFDPRQTSFEFGHVHCRLSFPCALFFQGASGQIFSITTSPCFLTRIVLVRLFLK
jgi:hypothetical protein